MRAVTFTYSLRGGYTEVALTVQTNAESWEALNALGEVLAPEGYVYMYYSIEGAKI